MSLLSWGMLFFSPFLAIILHFKAGGLGWIGSVIGGVLTYGAAIILVIQGFKWVLHSHGINV